MLSLIVVSGVNSQEMIFSIDFRIISGLLVVFLLPTILYHDRSLYSINDAFYLIGGVFFLGVSFSLLIIIRNISLNYIIYLFLISIITETYAYIVGRLIGSHKLLESISPNKTWEGMIAGTFFGVFIPTLYYVTAIDMNASYLFIIVMTLFL